MQDYLKNAGLILGHVICVIILLYCFANTNEIIPDESKTVNAGGFPSVEPTVAVTKMPTETATPLAEPSLTPEATPTETVAITPPMTPTLTETPMLTSVPVLTESPSLVPTLEPTVDPVAERNAVKQKVQEKISSGEYAALDNSNDSWWFRRKENHVPSGSGEFFDISQYRGYYLDEQAPEEDKVIYLTIDCGYGSSNTAVLLDIFKEQDVKVTFFVTNYFLEANPEEARRMAEEGHFVGNHSVTHPDLTTLSDEDVYSEIIGCEEAYYNITGKQMDLFFRPPGGNYSRRTMQITEDLGYSSIFWSIAYFDYDQNNQPGKEYVLNHFEQYHHNGAVVLMHNDSSSNREAMEEVILYLKQQGYRFGSLDELLSKETGGNPGE